MFDDWCTQYGKSYPSANEKLRKFRVFEKDLALITLHYHFATSENSGSYNRSLNAFADLTHEDLKATRLGFNPFFARYNLTTKPRDIGGVPDSRDVTEGISGASWEFSATGAVEGVNMIVNGSLISLSEQHLIHCFRTVSTRGCKSGHFYDKFQFTTEEEYPYRAFDMVCNDKALEPIHVLQKRFPIRRSPMKLRFTIPIQEVSARIVANCFDFQFYSKGIFIGSCSTSLYPGELDHALLIVGCGSENGVDYWILKNSQGKSWGMDGYMYMLRGHGNPKGVCGINMFASYPTRTPPPPSPTLCCAGSLQFCTADYPIHDQERNMRLQANGKSTGSGSLIGRSSRHVRRLLGPIADGITLPRVEDEIIPGTAQVTSSKPGINSVRK